MVYTNLFNMTYQIFHSSLKRCLDGILNCKMIINRFCVTLRRKKVVH